jgi:hypothetical protein
MKAVSNFIYGSEIKYDKRSQKKVQLLTKSFHRAHNNNMTAMCGNSFGFQCDSNNKWITVHVAEQVMESM